MPLPPAQVFPFPAGSSDTVIFTGAAILRGWSTRESSGSAAVVAVLRDGTKATAPLVAELGQAQTVVDHFWCPDNGILLRTGLFLDFASGAMQAEFWLTPISNADDLAWAFGESGPVLVHPNV